MPADCCTSPKGAEVGGETQQGICYNLGVHLQRRVQPVHRGEQGGQRAGVRFADKGGVKNRAYAVRALASALAYSPEMEASRLASSEASAAADTTPRRALATLVSTSSSVILAAMSRECWPTTEAVVGCHRGQRGVVGRGDGAVHGRRGAVVRQLQVHAVAGALRSHHALQHVEGRLVCLVGETRGQRALQRCDAASVRGHAIAGASALLSSFDASSAVTRSSRDWMAAALLPEAAVFTARSVT